MEAISRSNTGVPVAVTYTHLGTQVVASEIRKRLLADPQLSRPSKAAAGPTAFKPVGGGIQISYRLKDDLPFEYPGKAGLFWVRHEHLFRPKNVKIASFTIASLPRTCYECSWGDVGIAIGTE
jgi:hypothetical protein